MKARTRVRIKLVMDMLLFLSGLVSVITGLLLLFLPSGPGLGGGPAASIFDITSRTGLRLFHDWSSLLIIALLLFHLSFNWRILLGYIKNVYRSSFKTTA
jgi:hypothetical protein